MVCRSRDTLVTSCVVSCHCIVNCKRRQNVKTTLNIPVTSPWHDGDAARALSTISPQSLHLYLYVTYSPGGLAPGSYSWLDMAIGRCREVTLFWSDLDQYRCRRNAAVLVLLLKTPGQQQHCTKSGRCPVSNYHGTCQASWH